MRTFDRTKQPLRRTELGLRQFGYAASHRSEMSLLKRNEGLRDVYRGQRCFVVGNGPSLASANLASISGEVLIGVNNLNLSHFLGAGPQFQVISDRRWFALDPMNDNDREVREQLASVAAQSGAVLMPSSEAGRADALGLGSATKNFYFCNPFYFSDYYHVSHDFTGFIPRFSSVVHHAILLALHLGMSEIYLLGCDATNIVANVNSALGRSSAEQYGYPVSARLDRWLVNQQLNTRTMERSAESFLEVLIGYRFLNEYCTKRGVKLLNCSSATVVDSIQRVALHDVLCN